MMATLMVLALRMDHLVTMSGAMSVLTQKLPGLMIHAHAIILVVLHLHRLLVLTITVNQAIQTKIGEVKFFPNDKLWDGEQCSHEGTCCTGTSTPPWFSVDLNSSTSDDIEVRIIGTESTENEDTPIELLEIYVQ